VVFELWSSMEVKSLDAPGTGDSKLQPGMLVSYSAASASAADAGIYLPQCEDR